MWPFRLLLALFLLLAANGAARAGDSVDALVAEAIEANPDLAARRARVEELRALAAVAGSWPDPMIGVEYSNVPVNTLSLGGHPMAGLQLRAQQVARPPGWSRLQREVGDARVESSAEALAEAELQLGVMVEQTFWRLTLSRMLREETRATLEHTEALLQAVVTRYEVGRTGQHAVLRLEVLRDRLRDDFDDFDRADRELSAALARALARPADATFETPAELQPQPPPADTSGWVDIALSHRPELARIQADIRAQETAADLSRVDGRPDVTMWLGYRLRTVETATDPGTDLVSAGVSVPVPLGSGRRARGERAAHLHGAEVEQAGYAAAVDGIEADLETLLARWKRAFGKASTYDADLLPAARASRDTTLADYTVDKADFSSLYDAEISVHDLERALHVATIETYLQRAEARAVIGIAPHGESQ